MSETNKTSILDKTNSLLRDIATSPEYLRAREQESSPGENRVIGMRLGAFACESLAKRPGGYETTESSFYHLLGHLDTFAAAQHELDQMRNGTHLSYKEKRAHKLEVIRFNHAAKALINRDPKIPLAKLTQVLTRVYGTQHMHEFEQLDDEARNEKISSFSSSVRTALHGMRHELAYEQILGALQQRGEDIDYREATEQQELEGVDFIVTLKGTPLPIDVKSNRDNIRHQNQVWTHISSNSHEPLDPDSGSDFRITPAAAAARTESVLIDLLRILQAEITRVA